MKWEPAASLPGEGAQRYTYIKGVEDAGETRQERICLFISNKEIADEVKETGIIISSEEGEVLIPHIVDMRQASLFDQDLNMTKSQRAMMGIIVGAVCLEQAVREQQEQPGRINILICCNVGLERSVSAVILYLLCYNPGDNCDTFDKAYGVVGEAVASRRGVNRWQHISSGTHHANLGNSFRERNLQDFQASVEKQGGYGIILDLSQQSRGEEGPTVFTIGSDVEVQREAELRYDFRSLFPKERARRKRAASVDEGAPQKKAPRKDDSQPPPGQRLTSGDGK